MSVLIDDSDPLVQYNSPGGWTTHGKTPQFQNTTHVSATQGDTATLVFEGTSISVYGTVEPGSGESRLNFSIDGANAGSYQPLPVPKAINNLLFWTSSSFEEASHTLVITVDQDASLSQKANTLAPTLFLDYFIYQTTSTTGKRLLIDDTDPSVTYSPNWTADNTDFRLESTRHVSNNTFPGSWAAVAFNGTGISLFGSFPEGFQASIAIDETQSGTISDSTNQDPLFDSGSLPAGPHTINVTVLNSHSLVIDYFLVKNDLDMSVAPTASSSASASEPTRASSLSVSKAPNIAVIVGGTTGGLVTLALMLTFVFLRRRRARTRHNNDGAVVSVLPRLINQSALAPRPFPPSLRDETTQLPPPYTLKYLPVVGQ